MKDKPKFIEEAKNWTTIYATDVFSKDLMNDNFKGHHDSDKLSNEIMKIIEK